MLSKLRDGIYRAPFSFFIQAFRPRVIGLPSTLAVVMILPFVLATISVFPDFEGVGGCIGMVITRSFPLISTFIMSPLTLKLIAIIHTNMKKQVDKKKGRPVRPGREEKVAAAISFSKAEHQLIKAAAARRQISLNMFVCMACSLVAAKVMELPPAELLGQVRVEVVNHAA